MGQGRPLQRLGLYGTSERFWRNLQIRYDLELEKDRLGESLEEEVEIFSNASRGRI